MRKKKVLSLVGGICLILILAVSACVTACGPKEAEPTKITFADHFPATHFVTTTQMPTYFKMVEEATGGKYTLDIEYYPGSTLLAGAEIVAGVAKGVADAGGTPIGYLAGTVPVMHTMGVPGVAPSASCDAGALAAWEFFNEFKPKELEHVKMLWMYHTGPPWLHSKEKITTVEEMAGLQIRAAGTSAAAIKKLGSSAVSMTQGEVYLAAQKGIIDASIAPTEVLDGYKQHEVFSYSIFTPWLYSDPFFVVMNLDKWNSLPKDLQEAFDAVAVDACAMGGAIWQYNMDIGVEVAKASPGGHEFSYLSAAEEAKLLEKIKPLKDEYIAELNALGLPGEEIVSEAARIQEKYNAMTYEPWQP